MDKTRIIIAGIGGVGGYFGGLLAHCFEGSDSVAISFLARGAHLKAIRDHGLQVINGATALVARPALATDQPAEIGAANFILVCTKSYDLGPVLEQLRPCIHADTIILPLLNGVNNRERIEQQFPDSRVADGCVYIVSRLKEAGVVVNSGNVQTLFFGMERRPSPQLGLLAQLMKEAGIDATLSPDITRLIWEKFIFLSPLATATSFFDRCIGDLLADAAAHAFLLRLIGEVREVAIARSISVDDAITERAMTRLRGMPHDATSSMHADFRSRKPHTELDSLAGYVIREGARYGVATPAYQEAYDALRNKEG